jgi:hypothetical protein
MTAGVGNGGGKNGGGNGGGDDEALILWGGCHRDIAVGGRGISTTSRHISFEFLFIKTCPPDKLHYGFGFVVQFGVGIRYLSCQGGKF